MSPATQVKFPWRSAVRTVFQALVGICVMMPLIYSAATNKDPALATGLAGTALFISGAVARVMALPGVNDWLERFLPFLAAEPSNKQ